jgi:prophage antirepressor-like protein
MPFAGKMVRVVVVDGRVLFAAKDVCKAVNITWSGATLKFLEQDEIQCYLVTSNRGPRRMTLLIESVLYRLIFRSNKEEAKAFTRWVADEVLPSIRQTGSYTRPGSALAPSPAQAAGTDPAVVALLTELVTLHRQTLDAGRARERLARFPPSWQIPPDRLRMRMEDLIDTVAEVREWPRNSVIRQLNRVVRDWHHIDFGRRKWWVDHARGKHVSILSVIEHYGKLPLVYDFILSYYRDDLMATPQRRLSDVPLDRDDPMTEEERQLLKVMEFAMGGSAKKEPQ